MAKHHPDLIMCRKQPGIGTYQDYFACGFLLSPVFGFTPLTRFTLLLQLSDGFVRSVSRESQARSQSLQADSAAHILTDLLLLS